MAIEEQTAHVYEKTTPRSHDIISYFITGWH